MPFGVDLAAPVWVGVAAPPLLYAIVLLVLRRRWSVDRVVFGTAFLSTVHALLGVAAAAIYALAMGGAYHRAFADALHEFLTMPMLQLIWLPVMILPLRWVLSPRRMGVAPSAFEIRELPMWRRPAARVAPGVTAAVRSVSAAAPAVAPAIDRELPRVPEEATQPSASAPPSGATAATPEAPPSTLAAEARLEQALRAGTAPSSVSSPAAVPDDGQAIRVPFHRVQAQFPPAVFAWPFETVARELADSHHLRIPRSLVVPQLSEGMVIVPWAVVARQFRREGLALSDAEIERQLPAGGLRLPLDEVVRQFPPDVFELPTAPADTEAIESFPEPFHRSPESRSERATVLRADRAPNGAARSGVEPLPQLSRDRERSSTAVAESATAGAIAVTESRRLGDERKQTVDTQLAIAQARQLVTALGPLTPAELAVHTVAGRSVYAFSSDDATEPTAGVLDRLVPFLAAELELGSIEQITLHRARGAIVLTSLGRAAANAPVLAIEITQPRATAVTEILSRRAAREYARDDAASGTARSTAPAASGIDHAAGAARVGWTPSIASLTAASLTRPALHRLPDEAVLEEVAGTASIAGRITAAVFGDGAGERRVWIFAPRAVDLEALVSLADAFAATLDQEAASTLVATIGGRSLAVRPLVDAEGRRGAVAMLGGATNERGRLRRALDRASARLARA